jgi:hypothetical protein
MHASLGICLHRPVPVVEGAHLHINTSHKATSRICRPFRQTG